MILNKELIKSNCIMKPKIANKIKIQNHFKDYSDVYPDLKKDFLKFNKLIDNGILEPNLYDFFLQDNFNYKNFLSQTVARDLYIKKYGFFLLSEEFLNKISLFKNKKIIEVGAGSGFLSSKLKELNFDIKAIDIKIENNPYGFNNVYTDIIRANSKDFLSSQNNYDIVIMSWPNYQSNFANETLLSMKKGTQLLYIGESCGGCTANDLFFKNLNKFAKLNANLTEEFSSSCFSWQGIHDKIYIYDII